MRKLMVVLVGILVILSIAGPVSAKSVSSSAGGIGTSHTGAGVGSFEKMAGAGHSAIVNFFMEDTISGEGAAAKGSLSDSGINVEDYATVTYDGKITWDASVKGGDGEVSYSTGLYAEADEMPDPSDPATFWAGTEIWSDVKASADEGAVAKGKVTSSGTASATSVWDLGDGRTGSITSVSSGKTSASAEVGEYSNGEAWADLEGYTEAGAGGQGGLLEADIEAGGEMDHGTGEVESSASGTVKGTANAQTSAGLILATEPALSYNGMAVAEGSVYGWLEEEEACGCYDNDYYAEIDVGSRSGIGGSQNGMPDYSGAHIFAEGSLGSDDDDYGGSVESGAEGSGLLTEKYGGVARFESADMLDSVSGSASVEAGQKGSGWIGGLFAGLYSFDEAMPIMYEYPAWVAEYPFGIVDWETMILFDEIFDDSAFIGSRAEIETWGSGSGSAEAAASGKVVSSSTSIGTGPVYRMSSRNNGVEGSTKADASSKGYGYGSGDSLMLSRSSTGAEGDTGAWTRRDELLGYDLINLEWWTYAGTGAQVSSHSEARGAATTASSEAKGTVVGGASGMILLPGDPYLVYLFDSAANAAGGVSSEAKSRTEEAEAESASLLLATNAVGEDLHWNEEMNHGDVGAEFSFDNLHDFVSSQHSLLTSAAVWSPEYTGTSTATAKAAGTANSAGDLIIVEDWPADLDTAWIVTSSSSGRGTLASDFRAKDGYGIAKAWVHGGNFAGFDHDTGTPEIQSFDEDWLAGIHTFTYGEVPGAGNLKGTTSVKDGSSMEMASISYEEQDLLDPFEWNELYALDTYSRVTDKASAEVSVKKGGGAIAGSYVTAWNNAALDYGIPDGDVNADYKAGAYADAGGTGKAKAQIKPWSIVTSAEYSLVDTSVFPPVLYSDGILFIDSGAESAKFP